MLSFIDYYLFKIMIGFKYLNDIVLHLMSLYLISIDFYTFYSLIIYIFQLYSFFSFNIFIEIIKII